MTRPWCVGVERRGAGPCGVSSARGVLTSAVTSWPQSKRALAATYLLTPVSFGAGEESRTPDLRITNAQEMAFIDVLSAQDFSTLPMKKPISRAEFNCSKFHIVESFCLHP